MDSSSKRTKLVGAALAAALLVVVGVVALNNAGSGTQMVSLEHAQAIAKVANAHSALSNLPDESSVQTPEGWTIESDEPVESEDSEGEEAVGDGEGLEQEAVEEDEDIDSPLEIEEDDKGEKFVAELAEDVIVDADDSTEEAKVAADGKKKARCYRNLKACGAKKACYRKCHKKCRPYAIRRCKPKKFCRCFCKYYGKIKRARRCVIYSRRVCIKGLQYRCKRGCHKFCKRVPHCYCCPRTHIRRKCRRLCRRYMYRSKCRRCRCIKIKCYNACRFLCIKKY